MKAKFKFTNVNKEYKEKPTEKVKPLNEHSNNKVTESEVFNISELKKYYVQFTENSKKIEENFKILQNHLPQEQNILEENSNRQELDSTESKLKFLEEINSSIKDLREDFKLNATFLTNYDQHNYLNILESLCKKYNDFKEKINPRKKFAFASSGIKKTTNSITEAVTINSNSSEELKRPDLSSSINEQTNELLNTKFSKSDEEIIVINRINEKIILSESDVVNKNSLFMENLENCEIIILHNFKALYAKNIKLCKVYIGSISGGSHITDCFDSSIYFITHQLRIHKTFNTSFSIIVSSNPIIEDSTGLIFSSLKIDYKNFEKVLKASGIDINKNKWNAVLDFKWHKREKSPNFSYEENNEVVKLEL